MVGEWCRKRQGDVTLSRRGGQRVSLSFDTARLDTRATHTSTGGWGWGVKGGISVSVNQLITEENYLSNQLLLPLLHLLLRHHFILHYRPVFTLVPVVVTCIVPYSHAATIILLSLGCVTREVVQ